jgi:hypothetical protein
MSSRRAVGARDLTEDWGQPRRVQEWHACLQHWQFQAEVKLGKASGG